MFACRIWRFLKASKRSGIVEIAPSGKKEADGAWTYDIFEGDLAVECPACPHPTVNLPDGWERLPPEKAWLYTPFLALDGNFRLRCKDRKVEEFFLLDKGIAYYVNTANFRAFLDVFGEVQREVSFLILIADRRVLIMIYSWLR